MQLFSPDMPLWHNTFSWLEGHSWNLSLFPKDSEVFTPIWARVYYSDDSVIAHRAQKTFNSHVANLHSSGKYWSTTTYILSLSQNSGDTFKDGRIQKKSLFCGVSILFECAPGHPLKFIPVGCGTMDCDNFQCDGRDNAAIFRGILGIRKCRFALRELLLYHKAYHWTIVWQIFYS